MEAANLLSDLRKNRFSVKTEDSRLLIAPANNLTAKQEIFCEEVVSGKIQSEAYRTAYRAEGMLDTTSGVKHQS